MHNSIFQQDWWLDAVAPGRWARVEVRKGDRVVASMATVEKKRYGLKLLTMPPLTQFLGPWMADPEPGTKYATHIGNQKEWLTSLIEQLPAHDYFAQKCHPELTNWQPFYWKGFSASVRYTYVLENLASLDAVKSGFLENIRRDIKKAEKELQVVEGDVDGLISVTERSFERLGRKLPHGRETIARLINAATERGAGKVLLAVDNSGRTHAGMFYVWDQHCTNYVFGGGDPDLRNSGAISLLMWQGVQHAATLNGRFDFEGSMIEAVERFVRAFGGRQTPYFYLTRAKGVARVLGRLGLMAGARRQAE